MKKEKFILIFDIETVPDADASEFLLNEKFDSYESKVTAMKNYHLDITGGKNDFLRQPFHKVVAISAVVAKFSEENYYHKNYSFIKVGSFGTSESSEEDLIREFFAYVENKTPRLVSFNGRTFDLPVLRYRAMKYQIPCPNFYNMTQRGGYTDRYNNLLHLDLLDMLSDFGSSARIKLNEACSILNIPGKLGMDGSKVEECFLNGGVEDIRNYCESDVLNTWYLYLKTTLHRGNISLENYNEMVVDTLRYLKDQNKPHLTEFFEAYNELNDVVL